MAHRRSPSRKELFPHSTRAACLSCHEEAEVDTSIARQVSHPSRAEALLARSRHVAKAEAKPVAPQREEAKWSLPWRLRSGYRYVDVSGDDRSFDSDFGQDSGLRLFEAELSLIEKEEGTFADASLTGLEDRETQAQFRTGRSLAESTSLRVDWSQTRYVQDFEDDFHAYDRKRQKLSAGFEQEIGDSSQLRLTWERETRRGSTIATRIGNANQVPLSPASSIPAYRRYDGQSFGVALESGPDDLRFGIQLEYEEDRSTEDIRYARPSPANSAFTEQEIAGQSATRKGPGLQFDLDSELFPRVHARLEFQGRYVRTRYHENSTLDAWDSSAFRLLSVANASGYERSLLTRLSLRSEPDSLSELRGSVTWRDLKQRVRQSVYETTVRGLSSNLALTRQFLLSRARSLDGEASWSRWVLPSLRLGLAYHFAWQYVSAPDFEATDRDFRAGSYRSSGPSLSLLMKDKDSPWTIRARYALVEGAGTEVTETRIDRGQRGRLVIERKIAEQSRLRLYGSIRRDRNPISATKRYQDAFGLSARVAEKESLAVELSLSWRHIEASSLSNFYFAPSTTPVPTRVGYRGESLLSELLFEYGKVEALRFETRLSYQRNVGSSASSFFSIESRALHALAEKLRAGLGVAAYDSSERSGPAADDYDARVFTLFLELWQ